MTRSDSPTRLEQAPGSGPGAPEDLPSLAPRWLRAILCAAGSAALVLGVLGLFLPLVPTTPLVLLAAACYMRASPRAYRWLLRNGTFGPLIRQWRAHRTVPPAAKWTAIVLVFAAFAASTLFLPNCVYGYVTLGLLGSGLIVFLASLSTSAVPGPRGS